MRDKNTLGYMDRKCFVTQYTDNNITEFMNALDIDLTAKLQDLSGLLGLQCTFGLKIKHSTLRAIMVYMQGKIIYLTTFLSAHLNFGKYLLRKKNKLIYIE